MRRATGSGPADAAGLPGELFEEMHRFPHGAKPFLPLPAAATQFHPTGHSDAAKSGR
jgi:hypothetical protein